MESYQHQPPPHHHHYMRPPPPPQALPSVAGDPHYSHHHPPPPTNSWYSGQFLYHPSHSPSPPPPHPPPSQQNQWGTTPPPPPPQSYSTYPHQPFPPQPYPPPTPPPRPSQAPLPLPPPPPYPHQDWATANWNHHASWEYPAHGNEEDWAAKARAWASARSAMEDQHPQTQMTPMARQNEAPRFANHYAAEAHYQDFQQTSIPTSGFQNYQGSVAPLNRPPMVHQQDPTSISLFVPDAQFSSSAKDGALGGDMSSVFPHYPGSTSLVHKQEVPFSYSSIPGEEDGSQGQQHRYALLPANGRSATVDQAKFSYTQDPMDQPLDFSPGFSHENDSKMTSGYPDSSGPVRGVDSVSAWTALVAPGASFPPTAPAFPSPSQHDPSIGVPPLPGHPDPMFGGGPSFHSAAPSITTPLGLGTGSSLHPTSAFPADAYGSSLGSERPKKAAVPNWLREEIIKNKATISSSTPEHFKEGSQSTEDDLIGKSSAKSDQADSKSMDSARSTEEEDDVEDYADAQRTKAINQEIKRVLTEVLLKVTDELFDEIATKVLNEDDLTVDPENHTPILKASPSCPPAPVLKATTKVLIPVKAKESGGHASGESSSGTPGNVLGLANYASDEDEEVQTSSVSCTGASENGHQQSEAEDSMKNLVAIEGNRINGSSVGADRIRDRDPSPSKLIERKTIKDLGNEVHQASSRRSTSPGKKGDAVADDEKSVVKYDGAKSTDNGRTATFSRPDILTKKENAGKSTKNDSQERDARRRDRHESKRSSSVRDNHKGVESGKERESEIEETHGRRDEKRQKKDKTEDYNISKERSKNQDAKHVEKARDSDSRRRSPHREAKDKKERERDRKRSSRDDVDKKKGRTKDAKGDKSRHKSSSDTSRHKRRRSSSVGSWGRKNEESTVVSDGSDEEASDASKRKVQSKRRNFSPSPVKSGRRQVSRSPHRKHSQRRHSPYSSLDDSRSRRSRSRSRSRSPVRRRR